MQRRPNIAEMNRIVLCFFILDLILSFPDNDIYLRVEKRREDEVLLVLIIIVALAISISLH